jgi:integrase
LRFFTGLRPSEEIALVVTEYDRRNGVLSVTKARVNGTDHDVTKTREDRRVVLCPRAIAAIREAMNGGGPNPCSTPLNRGPRLPTPTPASRATRPDSHITIRVTGSTVQNEDTAPAEESEDSFASEIASSAALLAANYLKPMRIIGGADGTRSGRQ